jgi:asparagine synthase (glutamine-hydrolysing)
MTKPAFLGDFIVIIDHGRNVQDIKEHINALSWPPLGEQINIPVIYQKINSAMAIAYRGDVLYINKGGIGGVGLYHLVSSAAEEFSDLTQLHEQLIELWSEGNLPVRESLVGKYCHVAWDLNQDRIAICTDHFSTYPIYYIQAQGIFACATDLRLLSCYAIRQRQVDLRAIYHYLNFSYIPSPITIFDGIHKVPPGTILQVSTHGISTKVYWDPQYKEDLDGYPSSHANALRERIIHTVHRYRPSDTYRWGTFLSGGTDSSSISGILSLQDSNRKVASFSIGFEESGYDELAYSRIAARRYGLDAHIRKVDAKDTLDLLPRLIQVYDEPFGNSSAVPTYYCAKLAQDHGIQVLLAGDGGDEIFGGNERYRKDKILEWYYRAPILLKKPLEMAIGLLRPIDSRMLNRLKNFIYRASLPNPDRFYTDDSFASDYFTQLLTPDFRGQVNQEESLDLMRTVFGQARANAELHKLMYLDLKMTIADNDLIKVNKTSKLAGISVLYPYLNPELVDYTGCLPANWKVHDLKKRYLFKKALADILPKEILNKKKHGFGLPIGVWFREEQSFREFINDILFSQRAIERGYFQQDFIRQLVQRHERGTWDHSSEIWLLLTLELWHRSYIDVK